MIIISYIHESTWNKMIPLKKFPNNGKPLSIEVRKKYLHIATTKLFNIWWSSIKIEMNFSFCLFVCLFSCNANPVLRVDSSTTDPPYWVGHIPLYHSSFFGNLHHCIGVLIPLWIMSLLIHRTAKQLNRTRDGCIRKFEQLVLQMTCTAKAAQK